VGARVGGAASCAVGVNDGSGVKAVGVNTVCNRTESIGGVTELGAANLSEQAAIAGGTIRMDTEKLM